MTTKNIHAAAGVAIGGVLAIVLLLYGVVPHHRGLLATTLLIVAGGGIGRLWGRVSPGNHG